MHSWKRMVQLLEKVDRPETLGFQADMAHTLLYVLGFNAPEDALLPADWDWSDGSRLDGALRTLTKALRPWTIDFHVAQNDATVKGSGTHDKTGHHCPPDDPNGKLSIAHHAGHWLHGEDGRLTKAFRHICWDGCMFPNEMMMRPETWNKILAAMISVRDAHGWREEAAPAPASPGRAREVSSKKSAKKLSKTVRRSATRKHTKTAARAASTKRKKTMKRRVKSHAKARKTKVKRVSRLSRKPRKSAKRRKK
jgi:hypothetical protein